ncbi:hypothetical protein [Paraburkholderia susongensis]|uniref:Lysozyme inhibitor LprI N-terminal domain-containing protein n=1 Tax=Paraburkholderia susongensis TaxID=1515439 RepID=A0A1X7KS15_9BURK|nr:hypothetical protein [Paraburkholderia susongensis]SMG44381.1 hypothetical protein SAMN06265784_104263 [Paraburkholderia susongensis]
MKKLRDCAGTLFVAAAVVTLSLAVPAAGRASEERDDMKAEAAGERANFAQAFCQVSPERIDAYKEKLRKTLREATDFEQRWQTGWRRAENNNSRMNGLRERDPDEFKARVKVNCERLKWLAENSLRAPARK